MAAALERRILCWHSAVEVGARYERPGWFRMVAPGLTFPHLSDKGGDVLRVRLRGGRGQQSSPGLMAAMAIAPVVGSMESVSRLSQTQAAEALWCGSGACSALQWGSPCPSGRRPPVGVGSVSVCEAAAGQWIRPWGQGDVSGDGAQLPGMSYISSPAGVPSGVPGRSPGQSSWDGWWSIARSTRGGRAERCPGTGSAAMSTETTVSGEESSRARSLPDGENRGVISGGQDVGSLTQGAEGAARGGGAAERCRRPGGRG